MDNKTLRGIRRGQGRGEEEVAEVEMKEEQVQEASEERINLSTFFLRAKMANKLRKSTNNENKTTQNVRGCP